MTKFTSRQNLLLLLACALLWLSGDVVAWACPNCKDGLATDPAQAGFIRGMFWSIMFLLSMPFLITACMGGYFYWLICRSRKAAAAAAAASAQAGSPFAVDRAESEEELQVAKV
jgi:hypothetical protein